MPLGDAYADHRLLKRKDYFPLLKIKLNPGISRDSDQFFPVIPGYGKASEILNPKLRAEGVHFHTGEHGVVQLVSFQ